MALPFRLEDESEDLRQLCELDGDIFDPAPTSPPTRKHKSDRRAERHERYKERRRIRRRAKIKEKRAEASQKRRAMLDAMTTEQRIAYIQNERATKEQDEIETRARLENDQTTGRLKLWISLDFMDIMSEKESKSLAKQIQWMWNSIVRHSNYSVKITLGPFVENGQFHKAAQMLGFVNWKVNCDPRSVQEVEEASNVIVLSPDAEEYLTSAELDDDANVFVIGGIVDRTVRKNETWTMARNWSGVRCRKLPLHESPVKVHGILNVNTVYDIMAAVKFDRLSWGEAVEEHTPSRRHGDPKPRKPRIRGERPPGGEVAADVASSSSSSCVSDADDNSSDSSR